MKSIDKNSIDLIYLDPPFFTEKKHSLKSRDRTKEFSFDDIWGSDLVYGNYLFERIKIMKELLKDTGAIFVHCDKSGEHIIRAILDNVFGSDNFQSEIIWSYKRWSNSRKGLMPSHQNIYFYSRTKRFKFNPVFSSYSETTNIDQILQNRTRDEHNKSIYQTDGNGSFKHGKQKNGVPLNDVWEIPYLNPKAKERVGYPTQKPLLLIERIIELVTDRGDVVLDPFCGSGTTCVAAKLLEREFIGIDKSKEAFDLSKQRLSNPIKTESNLLKKGRESYLNADADALSLLKGIAFNPVHRNKGIDAVLIEQFDNTHVLVRVQKKDETLSEAISFLLNAKKTKRSKRAILIQTQDSDSFEEIAYHDGLIILQSPSLQIANLLKKELINPSSQFHLRKTSLQNHSKLTFKN
ncbi:MAG: site-specific DNA-methyltransferase [Nitrosomonas sp.]|nr:site-specific DNA-methyltransferase [Nitrosomonas sp.]